MSYIARVGPLNPEAVNTSETLCLELCGHVHVSGEQHGGSMESATSWHRLPPCFSPEEKQGLGRGGAVGVAMFSQNNDITVKDRVKKQTNKYKRRKSKELLANIHTCLTSKHLGNDTTLRNWSILLALQMGGTQFQTLVASSWKPWTKQQRRLHLKLTPSDLCTSHAAPTTTARCTTVTSRLSIEPHDL